MRLRRGAGRSKRSHPVPVSDGNKRIAFLAAVVFLQLNGKDLAADEAEVVQCVTALAAGSLGETQLATWMRDRLLAAVGRMMSSPIPLDGKGTLA